MGGNKNKNKNCGGSSQPENGRYSFTYDDIDREYYLNIPPTYDPYIPSKVAFLFHGWGEDGSYWMNISSWIAAAQRYNFILVAPTGLSDEAYGGSSDSKTSWTFRGSCTGVDPYGSPICDSEHQSNYCYPVSCDCDSIDNNCAWTHCGDDVSFVAALLEDLQEQLCIDESAIFATGHSNGGMFTWELGMNEDTAPLLTAIAPIVGLPHSGYLDSKGTDGSLPVLLLTGEKDATVPPGTRSVSYTESSKAGDYFYYVSASAITQLWANDHGCDSGLTKVFFPGIGWWTHCSTYCTTKDLLLPQVLDCRFSGGHSDVPSWAGNVVLEFFNAHATSRSCGDFDAKSACGAEYPRCEWFIQECTEVGSPRWKKELLTRGEVANLAASVLLTLCCVACLLEYWVRRRKAKRAPKVDSTELMEIDRQNPHPLL